MKTPRLSLLVVLLFLASRALAANVASEFTAGNEGWISISHTNENPPLLPAGIVQSDAAPVAANGYLRVQDMTSNWQWIKAPAAFLGDWRRFAAIKLGLVTDEAPTVWPIVLHIRGTTDGVTSSATLQFALAGTPGSARLDLTAALSASQWTLQSGTWDKLITNVEEFWIRMDLNSGVPQELDLIDYVRLVDSTVDTLTIHRAIEVEFFAPLGVRLQLQSSTDLTVWKNQGAVFTGDGTQQSRFIRVGDQTGVFYRLVRNP